MFYPPKESSLKNLSESSIGLSAILPYLFFGFFGFALGTRRIYCVGGAGGGGWGEFFWNIETFNFLFKQKTQSVGFEFATIYTVYPVKWNR